MSFRRAVLILVSVAFSVPAAWTGEVAVLKSADTAAWRPAVDALRRAAREHTITEYDLRGDRAEGERVLAGLKDKSVVVVAMGPLAAGVARQTAPELPLVYCMVQDPAGLGLLSVPNVAGVAFAVPVKNQLAAYRLVNPRGVRIGLLYSAENTGRLIDEARKAAAFFGLTLVDRPVTAEREVPQALRSILQGDAAVDALWIPPDPVLLGDATRRHVLSEALRAGKPVYSFSPALVAEGALVSQGPDMESIGEQAGGLVNRMAAGQREAAGSLLMPRAEMVINKKIADRLKLSLSAAALKAAGKVL